MLQCFDDEARRPQTRKEALPSNQKACPNDGLAAEERRRGNRADQMNE